MTGQINVNKIAARTGNTITVESGDVIHQPGSIIQAVQLHYPGNVGTVSSSQLSTTSTSYVDFLTKAITTKLANSLIYVKTYSLYYTNAAAYGDGRLLRDSTTIDECKYQYYTGSNDQFLPLSFQVLDSPNAAAGTTITYKHQMKRASTGTLNCGYGDGGGKVNSNMILMEIAP
jgi:hypothetical protein